MVTTPVRLAPVFLAQSACYSSLTEYIGSSILSEVMMYRKLYRYLSSKATGRAVCRSRACSSLSRAQQAGNLSPVISCEVAMAGHEYWPATETVVWLAQAALLEPETVHGHAINYSTKIKSNQRLGTGIHQAQVRVKYGGALLYIRPGHETSRHFPGGLEMSRDPNCLETFTLVR